MEREEREEAPLVGAGPQPQRILAKGKLLTLTAKEAEAYGVIRSTVDNVDQVLGLFDLYPAQKVDIVMTFPERAFRWLTNPMVAGILFMLAVGGLYLELKTPGFGLPGIVSIVAFTLFFGARAVLGLTDWIDLALVIIGLALIGVEVFVIPGFGVVGVAGILCLIAGLYLSFTLNDFEVPEYEWQYDRVEEAGVTMLTSFFLLTIFIIAVWKLLPYTPAYNWIVLSTAQNQDLGYVVQTVEQENSFIGLEGVAETVLRPAGKGRFGDQTVQVVSRAEFLPEGTPIVIVQVEGNRYVVNPLGDGSQENQV